MGFDNSLSFAQLSCRQTRVYGDRYNWREPEFCFSIRVGNVAMNAWLFTGEEE